jgi:hypothetical protein
VTGSRTSHEFSARLDGGEVECLRGEAGIMPAGTRRGVRHQLSAPRLLALLERFQPIIVAHLVS